MISTVPFTATADLDLGNRITPYLVEASADVDIREGIVPERLPEAHLHEPAYDVGDGAFLLRVPNGVRLLVEDGSRITYHRAGNSDGEIALFLTGSAWGALCYQRGLLPLHASGISLDGKIYAFTGPSGAGKSTIAAGLGKAGFDFFTDDIVILDPATAGDQVTAYAGQRDLKLWDDAIAMTASDTLQPVRAGHDIPKFYSTPATGDGPTSGPLAKMIVLARTKETAGQERLHDVQLLDGPKSLLVLRNNVYRSRFAEAIWGRQRFFQTLTQMLGMFEIYTFRRLFLPEHFDDSIAAMADWLRENS
ncbi:hypothetical protein [Aurantiacibacter sp. MUD61]|uniref:hypothetical protein n=1 Tax=Aurantiacibacter sp. MUD61 TaxID=3009083 RepID=UPI0022F12FDD|nr:hypothetical protein [Aurantiacibacter sp. MUD61]